MAQRMEVRSGAWGLGSAGAGGAGAADLQRWPAGAAARVAPQTLTELDSGSASAPQAGQGLGPTVVAEEARGLPPSASVGGAAAGAAANCRGQIRATRLCRIYPGLGSCAQRGTAPNRRGPRGGNGVRPPDRPAAAGRPAFPAVKAGRHAAVEQSLMFSARAACSRGGHNLLKIGVVRILIGDRVARSATVFEIGPLAGRQRVLFALLQRRRSAGRVLRAGPLRSPCGGCREAAAGAGPRIGGQALLASASGLLELSGGPVLAGLLKHRITGLSSRLLSSTRVRRLLASGMVGIHFQSLLDQRLAAFGSYRRRLAPAPPAYPTRPYEWLRCAGRVAYALGQKVRCLLTRNSAAIVWFW